MHRPVITRANHRLKLAPQGPDIEDLDHLAGPEDSGDGDEAPEGHLNQNGEFTWNEDEIAAINYAALGQRLAASGDLFRNPAHCGGLLHLFPDGKYLTVTKGGQLAPIIVDRVPVQVKKGGKKKGSKIDASHLNAMPRSRYFLDKFLPVDHVSDVPVYLPDFSLTATGYNDGGPGNRIVHTGGKAEVSDSLDTIKSFLEVMEFESNADRTNAVAAALTVMLRNFWPGGKPIIVATANKSHAGKDTVIAFATGVGKSVSISYQATNWASERAFVGAIKTSPDAAVLVMENARLDGRDRIIASAFLERFATDPEPVCSRPGPASRSGFATTSCWRSHTNYGKVSEDILNRSLPIHLSPQGDVTECRPKIGNPKLEFSPAN